MDQNQPDVAGDVDGGEPVTAATLASITSESEAVRTVLLSRSGLCRRDGDGERRVDVAVALLLTDRRLVFASTSALRAEDAAAAGAVAYGDLAATTVDDGRVELSTTDGVTWEFPLPDADGDVVDAAARDLRWTGRVRSRVLATRNDVELAAGRIEDATSEMAWDVGEEAYRAARSTLDDAIQAVQLTQPLPDARLAPELTDLERTLEGAYAELLIERAGSQLTLGQQLMEHGDVEPAAEVIESAREDHAAAKRHADALERADAFRFGEQRAVMQRLERLDWEMEAVAAEPLRQAHEAKILAQSTRDPDETVEHWETAFHRFGSVLGLEEGFPGERAAVREELANAAGQLIAIHQALARTAWDSGVEHHQDGAAKAAIRNLADAVEHLDRARELAAEFRPDAVSGMAERLESMREGIRRVRHTASLEESVDVESVTPDAVEDPDAQATAETETISARELAELDTHQEIALESELGGASDAPAPEGEAVVDPDDVA